MTLLRALSVSIAGSKSQKTWHDCGANDHFVCNRNLFVTYGTVRKATVNTCAGIGIIFGQGLVRFQMNSLISTLMGKRVPDIGENFVALSKLVLNYKTVLGHSE